MPPLIGVNCARLANPATLARALDLGLAAVVDLPGPHARSVGVVGDVLRSRPGDAPRLVAKVGYCAAADAPAGAAAVDGAVSHGLHDAAWTAAQVARTAEALGRPVDVALLHNPEEVGDGARRGDAVAAAAAAIRAAGAARAVGVSTNDVAWLATLDDVAVARVPAHALDAPAARAAQAALGARAEVLGFGPFRAATASSFRRLASPPPGAFDPADYVAASSRLVDHFTPGDGADDETREGCAWVTQLVSDLNGSLPKFEAFEQWELEITTQLVPMLHAKFEELDEDSADLLMAFFAAYGAAVRASADAATRELARAAPSPLGDGEALEAWALRDVAARPGLAAVLVALEAPEDADALAKLLAGLP